MVANCCICKTHLGQHEDLTFHRIPSNVNLAAKWNEIISRMGIKIGKCTTVCSRHFEDSHFKFKTVGGDIKRFLTSDAIPTRFVTVTPCPSNYDEVAATNVTNDMADVIEDVDVHESVFPIESENLTPAENSTLSKRKDDSTDNTTVKRAKVKTIRYIGDIGREDFTSDEAYNVVNSYVHESENKLKTLKQKVRRMDVKMKSMKDLMDNLRSNNLITSQAADFLQSSISPALHEILNNLLSDKSTNIYPSALQGFASSLLYYSTPAYEYVRSTFLKALPHPQTVRKWFRNVDFSPGIHTPILDNLKKLIQENLLNNKKLQFGLQVDEISIKRLTEWDGKRFHGLVDLGTDHDDCDDAVEANYALVFMLVALNGHFKTPIAYYFIHSLASEERANITRQILLFLHEYGISDICSLTFDGASTNISMVDQLGCNIRNNEEDTFFQHPATGMPVFVILDACHMAKLVRNTFADFIIIDDGGSKVFWNYIVKLVKYQEEQELHCATKIRRRHIDFRKEKMKVKLAVQVLSTKVSDALNFLEEDLKIAEFQGACATANFCRTMNDIFDLLNSRRKFGKNPSEECITPENINNLEKKVDKFIKYIHGLKIIHKGEEISILKSHRRTGFWGFIVGMKSVLELAHYVFNNQLMSYLLTYKLSQDHLETFFSCCRRMGGFNNNPSCRQFRSAYKKLCSHVNCIVPKEANCTLQDSTDLLQVSSTQDEGDDTFLEDAIAFDHDYEASNGWSWNEYCSEVVTHIAGAIVKSLKRTIKCPLCLQALESDNATSLLLKRKNRGGLLNPSDDVVIICKTAERVMRCTTSNILTLKKVLPKLVVDVKRLLPNSLFSVLDMYPEESLVVNNHRNELTEKIAIKYFKIRLHHKSRSLQESVQRLRSFHNRLVIFANQ